MNINWKGFFVTVAVIAIFNAALEWLARGFFDWIYNIEPTVIWKNFMLDQNWLALICLISLFVSFLFVIGFVLVEESLPGKRAGKGLNYGWLIWVIATVPSIFSQLVFMNISIGYIAYAVFFGLAKNLVSGVIIGLVYKKPKQSSLTGSVDRAVRRIKRMR